MWSYVIQLVFMVFLPIMGRNGTAANPDITIGKSCQSQYRQILVDAAKHDIAVVRSCQPR